METIHCFTVDLAASGPHPRMLYDEVDKCTGEKMNTCLHIGSLT